MVTFGYIIISFTMNSLRLAIYPIQWIFYVWLYILHNELDTFGYISSTINGYLTFGYISYPAQWIGISLALYPIQWICYVWLYILWYTMNLLRLDIYLTQWMCIRLAIYPSQSMDILHLAIYPILYNELSYVWLYILYNPRVM